MKLRMYQVDAFAHKVFEGNPAAVCPLECWLDDDLMQAIAAENNLSETAFFVAVNDRFQLRWFTPVAEVDMCGHATLAAAHVLFNVLDAAQSRVTFETRSGTLHVDRDGALLRMDFPVQTPLRCPPPASLIEALGAAPIEVLAGDDYIAVFESEDRIRSIQPDFGKLCRLDLRGVSITAAGTEVDFVSRFFAPKFGIPEDPVTGSAHCELAPYWASRLNKDRLLARQVSRRGGDVMCELRGERVLLSGSAVLFMVAEIDTGP